MVSFKEIRKNLAKIRLSEKIINALRTATAHKNTIISIFLTSRFAIKNTTRALATKKSTNTVRLPVKKIPKDKIAIITKSAIFRSQ